MSERLVIAPGWEAYGLGEALEHDCNANQRDLRLQAVTDSLAK